MFEEPPVRSSVRLWIKMRLRASAVGRYRRVMRLLDHDDRPIALEMRECMLALEGTPKDWFIGSRDNILENRQMHLDMWRDLGRTPQEGVQDLVEGLRTARAGARVMVYCWLRPNGEQFTAFLSEEADDRLFGVLVMMYEFSMWNGKKMHGYSRRPGK